MSTQIDLLKQRKVHFSSLTKERFYAFQRPINPRLVNYQQYVVGNIDENFEFWLLHDTYPLQLFPINDSSWTHVKFRIFELAHPSDMQTLANLFHKNVTCSSEDLLFCFSLADLNITFSQ